MADGVTIALIVAGSALATGIGSPLLLSWQQEKHRRTQQAEDYARQDAVAAQAAEAARLLLERQDAAAEADKIRNKLLLANNERVAAAAQATNGKLDQIHTLVNSSMTAAMQAQYDATVALVSVLRRLGQSAETDAEIEAAQRKADELRAALSDRLTQTKTADAQATESGDG